MSTVLLLKKGGTYHLKRQSLTYQESDPDIRPKSIAFKLVLKPTIHLMIAFWIKAFGEVMNVRRLNAETLSQDIQNLDNKIQNIDEECRQQLRYVRGLITLNKVKR